MEDIDTNPRLSASEMFRCLKPGALQTIASNEVPVIWQAHIWFLHI